MGRVRAHMGKAGVAHMGRDRGRGRRRVAVGEARMGMGMGTGTDTGTDKAMSMDKTMSTLTNYRLTLVLDLAPTMRLTHK